MSKRVVLLTMFVFCLMTSCLIWFGTTSPVQGRSQDTQADVSKDANPLERINEMARSAKGNDEIAIRRLTDVIFNVTDFAEISPTALEQVKERVVRAEINYRAKGKGGVAEKNITKMVNKLANALDAPAYAKTDTVQVRQLRVRLMTRMPSFMSSEVAVEKNSKNHVRASLKTEMSPLEATYMALFILQQKMLNKQYQMTPQEWRANLHKAQIERWETLRGNKDTGSSERAIPSQQKKAGLSADNDNHRRDEMIQVISQAIASKRATELKSLADTSLDDLGIAR